MFFCLNCIILTSFIISIGIYFSYKNKYSLKLLLLTGIFSFIISFIQDKQDLFHIILLDMLIPISSIFFIFNILFIVYLLKNIKSYSKKDLLSEDL